MWESTDLALKVIGGQLESLELVWARSSGCSHNEAKVEAAYGNFNIETSGVGMIEFSRELWKAVSSFSLALVQSSLSLNHLGGVYTARDRMKWERKKKSLFVL